MRKSYNYLNIYTNYQLPITNYQLSPFEHLYWLVGAREICCLAQEKPSTRKRKFPDHWISKEIRFFPKIGFLDGHLGHGFRNPIFPKNRIS
jgi:hypothetical protein